MLQLQRSSLIKTVAKKVNSFQNCFYNSCIEPDISFYHFVMSLSASIHYVSGRSRWIRVSVRNKSYAYSIFRKIHTYSNVFL